ncbi:MAG: M50 family metallopeptidase [Chloroflexota bacterium]
MLITLIALIAFLSVITILIIVHELGHFTLAKLFKIRVDEFGIGYPPRLFGVKRGETTYSLNALPLGGFTKMAGEEDPDVPRSLASKSKIVRLAVLGAGPLMNALLPLILFSVAFMVPHDTLAGEVIVREVVPGSPAAVSGIRPGDVFLTINGKPIQNTVDIHRYVNLNLGKSILIHVNRKDGTAADIALVPRWNPPAGEGTMGISIEMLNPVITREGIPFWRAIPMGVVECVETYILLKNEIIKMITGIAPVQIAGPVAIAQLTGEVVTAGLTPLISFAAFLSINLAFVNLLPLPALDGGRIAFVLLEWIRRGRRISPKTEGLVHLIGFISLLLLLLFTAVQDIIRIINGGSLLP